MLTRFASFFFCIAAATLVAETCDAGWHHRHGCGSCGSHHHRRHGSYGGSHGGSSGGSHGGSIGTAPAPKPTAPAAGKASTRVPATGALLVMQVPEKAVVTINGQPTTLTGAVREFVASGLSEDGRYEYEVTMIVDDGAIRREVTKTVWLAAGTEQTLAFGHGAAVSSEQAAARDTPAVTTNLTLTVPADAEVWIEGQRTTPIGAVRQYTTADLARGETWSGYEIRVVTRNGGKEQWTVKTVTLRGGENHEVAIDPDSAVPPIASTAAVR